jgi:hypothetical protein
MNESGDKDKRIDLLVDRTMTGLANLPVLEADGSFYSRVRQRLARSTEQSPSLLTRLFQVYRLRPALLAAVVCLNLATLYAGFREMRQADRRNECLETITDQYSVDVSASLFEIKEGQS